MYVDKKICIWKRFHLLEKVEVETLVKAVQENQDLEKIFEVESELLYRTETPAQDLENPTIELYDEEDQLIYKNK